MSARRSRRPMPRASLQPGESAERGRAARAASPRSAHGEWAPAPDRPDPVAVLAAQAATRVQELVPIRYGRMLVSPFTFYRGAAAVMAADLAATPDSGIVVQACGDAHISNFGGFAAPDRRLVFGPNDFDETLPGPWEWDVKRMAASVEIAGRDVGLPADRRRRLVTDCVREYREGDARVRATRATSTSGTTASTRASSSSASAGRLGQRRAGSCSRKPFAKARRKTSLRAVQQAHRARRRRAALPQRPAAARAASRAVRPGRRPRRDRRTSGSCWTSTPPSLDDGPALPVRHLPVRRHGPQGRRRRQRRHARLGVPVRRPRRPGPARAAGEGGAGVGARALPGRERVREPRRAGRPGPADLARGHRHLPQLAAQRGPRRQGARLLRPPALGLEGVGRPVDDERVGSARLHAGLRMVAGPRARPLRRPARDRRLPRRAARASTGRSPASPRRTPTRTSATTSAWPRPSPRARSRPQLGV